ncbi:hypothetical protein FPV67DRAFT_1447744 [Lyophyllum atratum]|nr:hypothetical protein FPV67DRAFT_1447744 [Lyophyllum atratum]
MPMFPGAQNFNIYGSSFTEVQGSMHNYNAKHGNISVQHGNSNAQSYPPSQPPSHALFASMSQSAAEANHDVAAQDATRAHDPGSQRWRQSFPMTRPAPADPEVRDSAENDGGRAGAGRRRGGSARGRRCGRGGRGGNDGTGGVDLNQEESDQVQDAVDKTASSSPISSCPFPSSALETLGTIHTYVPLPKI